VGCRKSVTWRGLDQVRRRSNRFEVGKSDCQSSVEQVVLESTKASCHEHGWITQRELKRHMLRVEDQQTRNWVKVVSL
jgi:hypothetical protein